MKRRIKTYPGRGYQVSCVLVLTPKNPDFLSNCQINPKNEFGQIILQNIGTLDEAVMQVKKWRRKHPDTETEYYKDFLISIDLSVHKEYFLKL